MHMDRRGGRERGCQACIRVMLDYSFMCHQLYFGWICEFVMNILFEQFVFNFENILQIFAEKPAVHRAFLNFVPSKVKILILKHANLEDIMFFLLYVIIFLKHPDDRKGFLDKIL